MSGVLQIDSEKAVIVVLNANLPPFICVEKTLMKQFFAFSQYESKKRISAEEAMKHVYFRSLGPRIHTLPESKRNSKVPLPPHFHLFNVGDCGELWVEEIVVGF